MRFLVDESTYLAGSFSVDHVHWTGCRRFYDPGHTDFSSTSADRHEPPHVHVEREESKAKFWLDPVRLERSRGFGRTELRRIEFLVGEKAPVLLRGWHGYFGN